jgi:hypothetical protein
VVIKYWHGQLYKTLLTQFCECTILHRKFKNKEWNAMSLQHEYARLFLVSPKNNPDVNKEEEQSPFTHLTI